MITKLNCLFGFCRLCLFQLGKLCRRQQSDTPGSSYFGILDGRHMLNLGAILAKWQRIWIEGGRVAVDMYVHVVSLHHVVLQVDLSIVRVCFASQIWS